MNFKRMLVVSMVLSCTFGTAFATPSKNTIAAEKMIEYSQYTKADALLKKEPKNIDAKALRIVMYARQMKLDSAQRECSKLLKTNPNVSDLHYAQGLIYMARTQSSDAKYAKNVDKYYISALEEFEKAIQLNKKNYRAMNAAGSVSLKLKDVEGARKYFNNALKIDSNYAKVIDNIGMLDLLDGDLDGAREKFDKALKIYPKNTSAMIHRAQLLCAEQNYSQALSVLNDARVLEPNSTVIFNLLGEIYVKQDNEAAAISAFKKAISAKPENQLPYLNLAAVYEKRGDAEMALEPLKTVVSINPKNYKAIMKIADISLGSGKDKQSIEYYSKMLDVPRYKDDALKGLAAAYFDLAKRASLTSSNQDLQIAFDYIEKAVEANPDDLEMHLAKLRLSKIANRSVQTQEALDKILKTDARTLGDKVAKGEACLVMNRFEDARTIFDEAIDATTTIEEDMYLAEIFTYYKQYSCAKKVLVKILAEDSQNEAALANWSYLAKCERQAQEYYQSAKFFKDEKNISSAIEYLNRSLSLNPDNIQATLLYAEICESQYKYGEAVANYKIYQEKQPSKKIAKKIKKLERKMRSKKYKV